MSEKRVRKHLKKSKAIREMEMAVELVREARDLIDNVLKEHLEPFNIASHYYKYGEYGFSQLLGEGNPYDGKLQDLIDKLKEEAL